MIPGDSRSESAFCLFSVPSWIWSCFCENHEKISFSRPEFVDSEIVIWELTSLTDLSNWVHLLLKKVKTYLRSNMGNNRQHALMLMHVNKNMLHNINLADVSKDFFFFFIEKTAANKHSDIFLRIIHNICKIKLKLIYFSYILPFYHSLNRFSQANDNRIYTSWKWFHIDVCTRST